MKNTETAVKVRNGMLITLWEAITKINNGEGNDLMTKTLYAIDNTKDFEVYVSVDVKYRMGAVLSSYTIIRESNQELFEIFTDADGMVTLNILNDDALLTEEEYEFKKNQMESAINEFVDSFRQ